MPCYHFIYHAYGTWMPDEDDGYVRRGDGHLPQDTRMAAEYRKRMSEDEAKFGDAQQLAIIEEIQLAAKHQSFRAHYVATEPTHTHILISWHDEERPFDHVRAGIRQSIARRLGRDHGKRTWLSEGGSRRKVICQEHYDYLVCTYLPRHSGWKWCDEKGLHK